MDTLEIALRLIAATAAGAAFGLNRDMHDKQTGVRTLGLVGLGSALAVMAAARIGNEGDVSRAIQGIVTGIGFLGAGVIMRPATRLAHSRTHDSRLHLADGLRRCRLRGRRMERGRDRRGAGIYRADLRRAVREMGAQALAIRRRRDGLRNRKEAPRGSAGAGPCHPGLHGEGIPALVQMNSLHAPCGASKS